MILIQLSTPGFDLHLYILYILYHCTLCAWMPSPRCKELAAPPPPPPEDGNPQSPPPAPSPRKTRQKVSALMEPGQDAMVGHRFASAKVTLFFFSEGIGWCRMCQPTWLRVWDGVGRCGNLCQLRSLCLEMLSSIGREWCGSIRGQNWGPGKTTLMFFPSGFGVPVCLNCWL